MSSGTRGGTGRLSRGAEFDGGAGDFDDGDPDGDSYVFMGEDLRATGAKANDNLADTIPSRPVR